MGKEGRNAAYQATMRDIEREGFGTHPAKALKAKRDECTCCHDAIKGMKK